MRNARRLGAIMVRGLLRLLLIAALAVPSAARADTLALDELLAAVVHIKTFINPDGRTVEPLGRRTAKAPASSSTMTV